MPTFQYKALLAGGGLTEGQIEAGGRAEAIRQIEARGLKLVRLVEGAARPAAAARAGSAAAGGGLRVRLGGGRIGFQEREGFIRQLAGLLGAGVPLSRALKLLTRETHKPAARERWQAIHDMVIDGASLADAMSRFPDTFPRVHIAMVQAGETGGFLDLVLSQIAEFQAREKELRGKVTAALVYPAVLLVLAIGVLIFLLTFFIPRFEPMFEGMGGTLPAITRVILAISHALTTRTAVFVVLGLVIAAVLVRRWIESAEGRRVWERMLLRSPLVGPLMARFALVRFARMLGTLLGAGVPLISALRVACESIGHQGLMDAVRRSIERVRQGDRLGSSLADTPDLFPASVLEVIAVAEESGRLDKELVRLADITEADLDRQLRMAVSLAEPVLLFFMAAFIGTIFVGMVLPIFSVQELVK